MRRFLAVVTLAVLLLAAVGVALPSQSEVHREAWLPAAPKRVLQLLDELVQEPNWAPWGPAREGLLTVTARTPRGLWFDVRGDRPRKAAIVIEARDGGTYAQWSDVERYVRDPLGRLVAALSRDRRVGRQLEASLEGLRRCCE